MTSQDSIDNTSEYECSICNDDEWIYNIKTNSAKPCVCFERKKYKRIIENSGLKEAFRNRTIENYCPEKFKSALAKTRALEAKNKAISYINNFSEIKDQRENSFYIGGQVGAGKTHLTVGILNKLMDDYRVGVRYMEYVAEIKKLKQLAMNEEEYNKEINKYKNATVLLIDDLFKKATYKDKYIQLEKVNDADIRIMYEIINHRYLNSKPLLISSEYTLEKIIDFDEALGTRILEMSKGYIYKFDSKECNYRVYGE